MELQAKATPLGIAVGLLSLLACGGNPSGPTPTLYDGTWRGTTSQMCGDANCPLVFTVAADAVTGVYLLDTSVKVTGDVEGRVLSCDPPGAGPAASIGEGCLEGRPCGTISPPVPIKGMSFGIVGPNFSAGTSLIDTMIGDFASPTSASGSLTYTIASVCVVRGDLTWTATKQ